MYKKKDTQKAQNTTKLTKSILTKIGNQSNTIKNPLSYQKVLDAYWCEYYIHSWKCEGWQVLSQDLKHDEGS